MTAQALSRAISIVGSQKKLAAKIGTTQSQVWYWLKRSRKGVPGEFAQKIEGATKGVVSRHELRPDVFGSSPSRSKPSQQERASG